MLKLEWNRSKYVVQQIAHHWMRLIDMAHISEKKKYKSIFSAECVPPPPLGHKRMQFHSPPSRSGAYNLFRIKPQGRVGQGRRTEV